MTRPDIELIVRNAKRLEKLSSDILAVARIESQSLTINQEEFELNQEVQNVVIDMKYSSIHRKSKACI